MALFLPVEPLGQNLTDGQGSLSKPKEAVTNLDKKGLVGNMEENEGGATAGDQDGRY